MTGVIDPGFVSTLRGSLISAKREIENQSTCWNAASFRLCVNALLILDGGAKIKNSGCGKTTYTYPNEHFLPDRHLSLLNLSHFVK